MFAQVSQTLICQDIVFSVFPDKKRNGLVLFVNAVCAGEEFTATFGMKSRVAVCDAYFKQGDYLPVMCAASTASPSSKLVLACCLFSLVERQQAPIV